LEKGDDEARKANMICGHTAVSEILETDAQDLALATSLGASPNGASKQDIKNLVENCGVSTVECDNTNIMKTLSAQKSDRAIVLLADDQGNRHAHSCFFVNGELFVVGSGTNGERIIN
jgi:hypothetical protein